MELTAAETEWNFTGTRKVKINYHIYQDQVQKHKTEYKLHSTIYERHDQFCELKEVLKLQIK